MAKKIIFQNNINNDSVQIGDTAYFVDNVNAATGGFQVSDQVPQTVGRITNVGGNFITIESPLCDVEKPSSDDFIMFQKDRTVNNTSLLGYFAEIKLINNSTEKAELFALSSEISPSSK